jgi:hypothetical protein
MTAIPRCAAVRLSLAGRPARSGGWQAGVRCRASRARSRPGAGDGQVRSGRSEARGTRATMLTRVYPRSG